MSNQTSEMFEFPKILLIYIIASTVVAAWGIDRILHPRPIKLPSLTIAVAIFVASQMLATVTSIDIHTSLFGYYGRFNGGLLSILAYGALFFVASQVYDTASFRKLLLVSVISSLVVFAWGLPGRTIGVDMSCILFRGEYSTACWTNEFRPQERMFSTLGQPNWLGVYLTAHVFIGLLLWIGTVKDFTHVLKPTKRNIIYGVYVLLMTVGVYFTASRSSQIGLVCGILFGVFVLVWRSGRKKMAMVFALILLVFTITFGSLYGYRLVVSRNAKITHSGIIRLIVWEGALKLAARYPLTGTGPETFAYSYFLTRPEAHNMTTERDLIYNKAHNEFLNFLATTGIIGLIAYVGMLLLMVRQSLRSMEGVFIAAGIVAIAVANFFGFSTSTGQILLFILPVYGILLASKHESLDIASKKVAWLKVILVLVIIGIWGWSMKYFYSYYRADLAYARATNLQYSSEYLSALDAFADALGQRFEHIYADKFAVTVAQTAYVLSQADTERKYTEEVNNYLKMAETIQTAAVEASPRNPMYWKDRVRMYELIREVVGKKEYSSIDTKIRLAVAQAAKLAPTDLEVREMKNSNSKR